jgi:uncharacterized protein (UPF0303 family)
MTIETDLDRIAGQERVLQFSTFDAEAAWRLGSILREHAAAARAPVAIDIEFAGMQVFFCALPGATPDNVGWIRRKRAVTLRFRRPSYGVGLALARDAQTIGSRYGLPEAEYAAHGGSFPLLLDGIGCVGAVTLSGLPQRDDHAMVVEALAEFMGIDPEPLRLDAVGA